MRLDILARNSILTVPQINVLKMLNNTSSYPNSPHHAWSQISCCPYCGSNISAELHGTCGACKQEWFWADNILHWGQPSAKKQGLRWKILFKKIKNQCNPMSNWLSPFRIITHISGEKYYKKTLHDKALAKKWYDHYLKDLHLNVGDLALDFGCGRGRITALSNQMGFHTVGQDVEKKSWWKKITHSEFQVTSPNCPQLPWHTGIFSVVFCFGVLHHLDEQNLERCVREIFRVLKPGGYFIILEANDQGYNASLPRQYAGRLHSLLAIRQLCQHFNFNELSLTYEGFYSPIFPLFINFTRKLFSLKPFDISDFDTYLERITPPEKRALWLMRLQKSYCTTETVASGALGINDVTSSAPITAS